MVEYTDHVVHMQRHEGHGRGRRPRRGHAQPRKTTFIRHESGQTPLEGRQSGDRDAGQIGAECLERSECLVDRLRGGIRLHDDGVDRVDGDERVAAQPGRGGGHGSVGEGVGEGVDGGAVEVDEVSPAGESLEDRDGVDAGRQFGHDRT